MTYERYSTLTAINDVDGLVQAVLAVRLGTSKGTDYCLVQNSLSTNWGNECYILMSARNNYGVMTIPTYVEM
ncbi:GL23578 [Drosophila persimilis]|uniref:GL23578 n=1 Tax=Drosophila persimilis TaxID=7234 RepID=B4G2M1_DROPE|nr:GL23578 [Drosophila persimilis]